jgi:hypothetical protein
MQRKESTMAKNSQASKPKSATSIIQSINVPEWLILHTVPKGKTRPQGSIRPAKGRGAKNQPNLQKRPTRTTALPQ